VGVTISHAQRDAVYDQILDRLSGIEDIWLAASTQRYETADRLGREYSDELRLILDDLGWGDGPEVEAIELTTAPDVLRRVFGRLRDTAAAERARRQTGWFEGREEEERNRLVGEACQVVLAMLGEDEVPR
jgi:hypothetical protein